MGERRGKRRPQENGIRENNPIEGIEREGMTRTRRHLESRVPVGSVPSASCPPELRTGGDAKGKVGLPLPQEQGSACTVRSVCGWGEGAALAGRPFGLRA